MTTELFQYRTATAKDNPQLKQLGIDSYTTLFSMLTEENQTVMLNFLHDDEKVKKLMEQSHCFVCECNNTIVGMAYFIPHGNAWDVFPDEWSYIRMVGVHPAYQGRGIARKLMEMCIAKGKETSEKIIALHTSEIMNAARYVYESLGFTILREIEPRFGVKYWLYTLELEKQ